jgi:integrase
MATVAFTDKWIKSVKPPAMGREEHYDASVKGLEFRVTAKGARSWRVRYTVRGLGRGQEGHTIGSYPGMSLADARDRARAIIEAAQNGTDLIATEAREKEDREAAEARAVANTVDKIADIYEADYREHYRANSVTACVAEMRYVRKHLGSRPIGSVKLLDVEDMCKEIGAAYPTQANRVWSRARAFFTWSVAMRHVEVNVCAGTSKKYLQRNMILKKEQPKDRALDDDEIRRVLAACDVIGFPSGFATRFLLLTGCRRDEVLKARWKEINLETCDWVIPAERYKTKVKHLVPLPTQAVELLRKIKAVSDSEYVFSGPRRPNKPYSAPKRLKERLDQLSGVVGWTIHDTRRTVRSGMARLGIHHDTAERVIGHAVGTSLSKVYDVYDYRKEKVEALQRWADHLDSLLNQQAQAA